jgi:hypothetical protein
MSLAYTELETNIRGSKFVKRGTLAFDDSYPSNGEGLSLATLGLSYVDEVRVGPTSGYIFEWDGTNKKIKAFWVDTSTDGAPLAEVANTTDLSALTAVPIVSIGV